MTANSAENKSVEEWRSQFVTSNFARMGLRKPPYAFTRNGIGMCAVTKMQVSPETILQLLM